MCELWPVAEPSQNKKRTTKLGETKGKRRYMIARGEHLDTGEKHLINTILALTK